MLNENTSYFKNSKATYRFSFLDCPFVFTLNACTEMSQMFLFPLARQEGNEMAIPSSFRADGIAKKFTVSERSGPAAEFLPSSYGCDIFKIEGECHRCFLVNVSFKIIVFKIVFSLTCMVNFPIHFSGK